jgi:hypothetical protein
VITLGESKFGSSEYDTVTLEGFRSTVEIDRAGGVQMSTLKAKIFGVKQDDMNAITTLQWNPLQHIKNTVQVFAIDGDTETLVYRGDIVNAWGDYQSMPDVYLYIHASSTYYHQLGSVPPISFKGSADVATLMSQIAGKMGLSFEPNGVSVMLSDMYVAGTLLDQAKELARAANINLYIDDDVMAITAKNGPREGDIPLITKDSGMIGYPTFDGIGVMFRTLYNPAIKHGGSIQIESELSQAAGEWIVVSVAHTLEAEKPGGLWQSVVRGNKNGLAVVK